MLLVARCNNAPTGEIQLKYTDRQTVHLLTIVAITYYMEYSL